jgi:hypothetical protein
VDARRFLKGAEADKQGAACCRNNPEGFHCGVRFRFEIPKDELAADGAEISIVRAKEFPAGRNVQSFRVEQRGCGCPPGRSFQ